MKTRLFFLKQICRNERGAASLEAALVLPVAFVLVIGVLFMLFLSHQAGATYVTAAQTADRAAHVWDNSYKHPVTGMFHTLERDPLYWRWFHDGAEQWFGPVTGHTVTSVSFPEDLAADGSSGLTERKLTKAAHSWPAAYFGEGEFRNRGLYKSVTMSANVPFKAPDLFNVKWAESVEGRSAEIVIEPSEYIRNVELLFAYIPAVVNKIGNSGVREALAPWMNRDSSEIGEKVSLTFRTHAEAVRYTRALVHGQEKRIPTIYTGSWRLIDALDKQGIAHQTFIGVKSPNQDITAQMLKDVELLERGEVNGVVWHFFRRTGETDSGPTPALRRMLEQYGIMIVIHS
jgi:hypothetical protein